MTDDRIAELERALAEATLSLEQAREQLSLLPGLNRQAEEAVRRLGEAEEAYGALRSAYDGLMAEHVELQEHFQRLWASRDEVHRTLRDVYDSRSWRYTRPLRRLSGRPGGPPPPTHPPALPLRPPERAPDRPDEVQAEAAMLRASWEYPPAGIRIAEYLHVSGWAAGPAELTSGEISCGDATFPLRLGRPRWDVAALFPEYAHGGGAGFEMIAPARGLPEGEQVLRLVVRDRLGAQLREERTVVIGADAAYERWLANFSAQAHAGPVALPEGWELVVGNGAQLRRDATARLAEAITADPMLDAIYGDHDHLDAAGRRRDPFLKPGWSPELLEWMDYSGPVLAVRSELLQAVGRDQGPDELLRRLGRGRALRVQRVPAILASLPAGSPSLPRPPASPSRQTTPQVSVLICSANAHGLLRPCLQSLRERTTYGSLEVILVDTSPTGIEGVPDLMGDLSHQAVRWRRPFNYSAANNLAAEHAQGEFLILLNDDTELLTDDWVERLLDQAERPGVGVVGAKLVRPDGTLQHGGVRTVTRYLVAKNLSEGLPADDPGYHGLLTVPRNCSAVTFACAMVSSELYSALGGLDAELAMTFNDIDFCLRARERGRRVVWTPRVELLHHEHGSRGIDSYPGDLRTFRSRWGTVAAEPDPYYHPLLSDIVDYELLLADEGGIELEAENS